VTAPHESDISNASEYNYKNSISLVILAISKSSKYVVSYIFVYPSPPCPFINNINLYSFDNYNLLD
jgi:hypothetical protein